MTEGLQLHGMATGSRGSLFATVRVGGREDRSLPCVLSHWFRRFAYDDPLGGRELPRLKAWHDAMRDLRQVVVAQAEVAGPEGSKHLSFRRVGYVGVYTISDLEIDRPCLRFTRAPRPIIGLR